MIYPMRIQKRIKWQSACGQPLIKNFNSGTMPLMNFCSPFKKDQLFLSMAFKKWLLAVLKLVCYIYFFIKYTTLISSVVVNILRGMGVFASLLPYNNALISPNP